MSTRRLMILMSLAAVGVLAAGSGVAVADYTNEVHRSTEDYDPGGASGSAGYYIVKRSIDLPLQILLGLIIVGIAIFVFLDPQKVRGLLTGRQAKYGSNALIISISFIGIWIYFHTMISGGTYVMFLQPFIKKLAWYLNG